MTEPQSVTRVTLATGNKYMADPQTRKKSVARSVASSQAIESGVKPKKKKAAISPTQLTLKKMRADGYLAAVVEHWNPHARIRQDLFGIVDVIGVSQAGTLAVQSTTWANISSRVNKITDSESLPELRKAGWRIVVHGWKKVGARWQLKEIDLS